jgi:hypothetical protein
MKPITKRNYRRDRQYGEDHSMRVTLSNGHSPCPGTSRDQPVDVDGERDVRSSLPSTFDKDESLRKQKATSGPAAADRKRRQQIDSSKSRYFPASKPKLVQQVDLTSDDEVEYLPEAKTKGALALPNVKSKSVEIHEDPHDNNISLNQRYNHELRRRAGTQDVNDHSIDELAPGQNTFPPPTRPREQTPTVERELPDSEDEREENRSGDIPSQFSTARTLAITRKTKPTAHRSTQKPKSATWTLTKYTAITGVLEHVLARIEDQNIMVFVKQGTEDVLESKYNINLKAATKVQWNAESNLVRVVAPGRQAWDLTFANAEEATTFIATISDKSVTGISEVPLYVYILHRATPEC